MTKAFLVGIQELEEKIGAKETDDWMKSIGEKLAEMEGPGLMGDQEKDLYNFRICLFAPKLDDFIEEMGLPKEHEEILKHVKSKYDGPGGAAPVNVMCSMCYSYRKKRAQMAGKKDMMHLAAKYKLSGVENFNDEKLLKEAGYTKAQLKSMLKEYDCINKYVD
jgi:hypothetical protein